MRRSPSRCASACTRRRERHPDTGSALVEFVTLGVLLLVPIVYLVLTLGRLQAAAYAADGAAREAARAFVTAPDESTGRAHALAAVRLGLLDQGFDVDAARVTQISCRENPCLTPEGRVDVAVSVEVVLPGVPGFVDRFVASHVTVRSTQTAVVDAFRASPVP
jgi:TadE-like protein